MSSIGKVLDLLHLRYHIPQYCITDASPSFRGISENKDMLAALSSRDNDVMVLPEGHQFSNYSERIIQEGKNILNSLREDTNCSIFRQHQKMLQLIGKLRLVLSILSLMHYIGASRDKKDMVVTPKRLSQPFFSGKILNQTALDIFKI